MPSSERIKKFVEEGDLSENPKRKRQVSLLSRESQSTNQEGD
jgi:hypothetical protein